MAPIAVERLIKELEKLKQEMDGGKLRSGEYDQRLARVIQELRERKLDADRAALANALNDAAARGVITAAVKAHLLARLGLS